MTTENSEIGKKKGVNKNDLTARQVLEVTISKLNTSHSLDAVIKQLNYDALKKLKDAITDEVLSKAKENEAEEQLALTAIALIGYSSTAGKDINSMTTDDLKSILEKAKSMNNYRPIITI